MRAAIVGLVLVVSSLGSAAASTLPVPPIPPRMPPPPDAPVPNLNIRAPYDSRTPSSITLDSGMLRREDPDPSLGYAPGAHYRMDNDRRLLTLPGILLRVPLP